MCIPLYRVLVAAVVVAAAAIVATAAIGYSVYYKSRYDQYPKIRITHVFPS